MNRQFWNAVAAVPGMTREKMMEIILDHDKTPEYIGQHECAMSVLNSAFPEIKVEKHGDVTPEVILEKEPEMATEDIKSEETPDETVVVEEDQTNETAAATGEGEEIKPTPKRGRPRKND